MKKILSLITIASLGVILSTGCESNLTKINKTTQSNINSFKEDFSHSVVPTSATILNKYNVELENNLENDFLKDYTIQSEGNNLNEMQELTDNKDISYQLTQDELEITDEELEEAETQDIEDCPECDDCEISTLYSLSNDISESCETFCELKTAISNAIIETENLIKKLQNNEIKLSAEEKMTISDQSRQLKVLGKQLSYSTSELAINLSDLASMFEDENGNLDTLNMKYLIVLDNLVNGNEMLYNSLYSLNTINLLLGNNINGNMRYFYQRNNEPPIYKNYSIDNGEISENDQNIEQVDAENDTTVIDSYSNNKLKSNIDTYGNTRSNIDTFFNTAWLDNDFMYGNGGYGMPYGGAGLGMRNSYYPYVENNQVNNNNTTNGVNDSANTPQNDNVKTNKKTKNKFKLQKNIDTYRDANTPTVSAKLTIIKDSISNFFSNLKNNDNAEIVREKIENNLKD